MTGRVDCVVVGGGPAGATAATELAQAGYRVVLLDRAGRIKPCGGAVPPRLIRDFDIPADIIVGRALAARVIGPDAHAVDMPVNRHDPTGYVGMVDRDQFDEFLRTRAADAGATRVTGRFDRIDRDPAGRPQVIYTDPADGSEHMIATRTVIGADGARSRVGRGTVPGAESVPCVYAYHEVIRSPRRADAGFDRSRCDVFYEAAVSPDFYGWIFPHGDTASVGVGSARKGFGLRDAVRSLRQRESLGDCETIRSEGAPIPLRPLKRWDNGRDVILAGDAAGVVAPASGEGIYYAMVSAREVARAVGGYLVSGRPRELAKARQRFMRAHGQVFWILGIMQHFWYRDDRRRERFVTMCEDRDVQDMIWPAYMNKKLVYSHPIAYLRIFFKDMRHLIQTARIAR